MEESVKKPPLDSEEDEDAAWEKFNPMKEHFENIVENSYTFDSVGGTLPRRLLSYSKTKFNQAEEVKLFVTKIPVHITESGLRNIFALYGKVLRVHIVKQIKRDNSSHYFGFVSFSNLLEADRAIQGLNHVPPYYFHIEFEISEEERKDKQFIETCASTLDRLSSMNFNHQEASLYEADADFTIRENVSYSPGLPGQGIDLSSLPSRVDALLPYHLYKTLPRNMELYEPYLLWEEGNNDDGSLAVALQHYIISKTWLCEDVKEVESSVVVSSDDPPSSNTMKTFGIQGTNTIKACVFCKRKVFKTNPLMCKCSAIYDDIVCQHKHWPQHKTQCSNSVAADINENATVDTKPTEDDFSPVIKAFKSFYNQCGTVLDKKELTNCSINMIPEFWWDSNSALVCVTADTLVRGVVSLTETIGPLPDITHGDVEIGQLVGVYLEKDEMYARGVVACKTRLGLIGVLALELRTFVLVHSVKLMTPLSQTMEGAYNVQCSLVNKDKDFVMEATKQFSKLKSSNRFRSFDSDLNSCTVELSPYLPVPEQLPLPCLTIDSGTKVVLTAFHSLRALYIQPLDVETKIRYASMASEVNLWCTNNHRTISNPAWVPKKNQMVGVRLPCGEYRRAQIIGTVVPKQTGGVDSLVDKNTEGVGDERTKGDGERIDSSEDKRTEDVGREVVRHYVVSLIDSGDNLKVSVADLLCLPSHLKQDLCYCNKISLTNTKLTLNPSCFRYLNLLVEKRTPLVVDYVDDESMVANLILETGDSVGGHLESLTTVPWKCSNQKFEDPTKTDKISRLSRLCVPLYPLHRGKRLPLRLMKILDLGYASMLVLYREEARYIQDVLAPLMRDYCEELSCTQYNPPSGGYCLAYCREIKLWTRAYCEKASDQHGHCFVFLVDHGVHAHLPITDLRPCHELFTQYYSLAFIAYIPEFETTKLPEAEIMSKYLSHTYTVMDVVSCDKQIAQDRVVLAL